MALNTAANWATIGSFAVDVFSLGFLTINKHANIRDPLAEADAFLDGAIDRIANYSVFLDDQEFDESMEKYEKARTLVDKAYQDRSSFENFIVRAKKYSKSKKQVNVAKLKSQEVANWKTSVRAKRRVDVDQRTIDQHKMGERLGRLTKAGFKLSVSGNDSSMTRDSESEVAQPPSSTPSRAINELNSPFQDPNPKDDPWKTATVSNISLQSFVSK